MNLIEEVIPICEPGSKADVETLNQSNGVKQGGGVKQSSVLSKCDACTALCCQYITQAIDTPTTKHEFDTLLWQISHRGVHVFKDDNGWYLLINTPCSHLLADHRCGIYLTRPTICREHSTEGCERDVPMDEGCELYFQSYQELDDYCRRRFKRWDDRFRTKSKKKRSKDK